MLSPGSILPPVDFKRAFRIIIQFFYFFWKKRHLSRERLMICYFRHYKHYLWSKADDQRAKPLYPRFWLLVRLLRLDVHLALYVQSAYVPLLEVRASNHESILVRYNMLGTCAYIASVRSCGAQQACFLVICLVSPWEVWCLLVIFTSGVFFEFREFKVNFLGVLSSILAEQKD